MKLLTAEAVVANTIRMTELLLTQNQVSWKDARDGIEFIKEDLAPALFPKTASGLDFRERVAEDAVSHEPVSPLPSLVQE